MAAIISAHDLERLSRLDAERERQFKVLNEIGEDFKDVPDEESEMEIARAVAQARAKLREEAKRGTPVA